MTTAPIAAAAVAQPTMFQSASAAISTAFTAFKASPYAYAVANPIHAVAGGLTAVASVVALGFCCRSIRKCHVKEHAAVHAVATQAMPKPAESPAITPVPSRPASPATSPRHAAATNAVVTAAVAQAILNNMPDATSSVHGIVADVPAPSPAASPLASPAPSPKHEAVAEAVAAAVAQVRDPVPVASANGAAPAPLLRVESGDALDLLPAAGPAKNGHAADATPAETPLYTPVASPKHGIAGAAAAAVSVVSTLQTQVNKALGLKSKELPCFRISYGKMLGEGLPELKNTMTVIAVVFKSGREAITLAEAAQLPAQYPAMKHLILKYRRPTDFVVNQTFKDALPGVKVVLEVAKKKS